jgi:hypothetical protein
LFNKLFEILRQSTVFLKNSVGVLRVRIHNNAKTKQVSQHLIPDLLRARINAAAQIKNGQTAHFYYLVSKNCVFERNLTTALVPPAAQPSNNNTRRAFAKGAAC